MKGRIGKEREQDKERKRIIRLEQRGGKREKEEYKTKVIEEEQERKE